MQNTVGAVEVEGTIELRCEGEAEGKFEAAIDGALDIEIVGEALGRRFAVVRDGNDPIPSALLAPPPFGSGIGPTKVNATTTAIPNATIVETTTSALDISLFFRSCPLRDTFPVIRSRLVLRALSPHSTTSNRSWRSSQLYTILLVIDDILDMNVFCLSLLL